MCNRFGYVNACQVAKSVSTITDGCNGTGNHCIVESRYESIASCLDDTVTIIARIICRILTSHGNTCQTATTCKGVVTYSFH